MSDYPKTCHIMEVGPRDGLQIESKILSVDEKLQLIRSLEDAGFREIEVGSFVNPKAVPQMADSAEVFEQLTPKPGILYRAIWLNSKGLQRAIETANVDVEGVVYLTASEAFVKRNTNRSIDESFEQLSEWISLYSEQNINCDSLGMLAAFGCNFEGDIPTDRVIQMIRRARSILSDNGQELKNLSLADTMGWATPDRIKALLHLVNDEWPELSIKLHLHDTRGMAMANAYAALEMGVDKFDSSIAGLGGCPFAGNKSAAGNISSEVLAIMCEEMGISTGLDLDALIEAAKLAEELVGRATPGKAFSTPRLDTIRRQVSML